MVANEEWESWTSGGGKLKNAGKRIFLELVVDLVREVEKQGDSEDTLCTKKR